MARHTAVAGRTEWLAIGHSAVTRRTDWWSGRVVVGMQGEGGGHRMVGKERLHHTMHWLFRL